MTHPTLILIAALEHHSVPLGKLHQCIYQFSIFQP